MVDNHPASAPGRHGGPCRARFLRLLRAGLPALLVIGLGGLVRAVPFVGDDFPLHDGGMFSVMASELLASGLTVPAETSFNHAHIPFAYPPVGLMAAALGLAVLPMEDVFRGLPFIYAVASVGVMYWLARSLPLRGHPLLPALAFALMPHAFDWLILGGGVTRGPGLILAMLAIGCGARLFATPSWALAALTGLLGALSVLTHPEAGIFAAASLLVILSFSPGRRVAVPHLVGAGLIGLLATLPWWVNIMSTHGVGIFLAAGGTRWGLGNSLIRLTELRFSGAPLFVDVFLLLGMIGAIHEVRKRRWLLPAWMAALILLMPGSGAVFFTVPLALLCAAAMEGIGYPLAQAHPRVVLGAAACLFGVALFTALNVMWMPNLPVDRIPASDREVMGNLRDSDLENVGVLTGRQWWDEGPAEWFPALSNVRNPVLVQGTEWLGTEAWDDTQALNLELQVCAYRDTACLVAWMQTTGVDHVLVSAVVPDGQMRNELAATDGLQIVLERGRTVLVRLAN
jgi:hypothetical protein